MKVLLAIDASQASKYVVDEATARPWPKETEFSVINVVDLQPAAKLPPIIETAKLESQKFVKAATSTLSGSGHKTTYESFVGFAKSGVSEYAKQWGADLIMAGSHGQGALKRFLLGSVAQGILRTAPCSVEIVRPSSHGAPASSHALKILLATDGSECSIEAARSLANRPWPKGSQAKIMSAVELIVLENQVSGYALSSVYPQGLVDELMNDAQRRAKEAVEKVRSILTAAKWNVVPGVTIPLGDPRIVILDEAKEWGADLMVMGSHGRRGFDRLMLGSVSESVAIHAHCSVEVIRSSHPEHSAH